MNLKDANGPYTIWNHQNCGPAFGHGIDMHATGLTVNLNPGGPYHPGPLLTTGSYTIKEMEVYRVTRSLPPTRIAVSTGIQAHTTTLKFEPVTRFLADINEAINAMQACLLQTEADVLTLEESFNYEQTYIKKYAWG